MIPTWLKRKLGIKVDSVHPDDVRQALDENLERAEASQREATKVLAEVKRTRQKSRDAHDRMARLREDNHFADMMYQALGGSR